MNKAKIICRTSLVKVSEVLLIVMDEVLKNMYEETYVFISVEVSVRERDG